MQYYMSRSIFPESFIGLAGGRNYPVTLPIADFKLRFLDSDFSAFRTRLASKSPRNSSRSPRSCDLFRDDDLSSKRQLCGGLTGHNRLPILLIKGARKRAKMKFQVFAVFEGLQMLYNQNNRNDCGRVAQLGEHLLCKQGVAGSIPVTSTKTLFFHCVSRV
jgi:hypothetical protein